MRLNIPGIRLRGNIWIGEGVDLHDLDAVEGPAFIGNYCRVASEAVVSAYSVLNASVTLRERAHTTRSVIDTGTHLGASSVIEGAIIGRSCDIRSHVRVGEGVAIGDEVTIGQESVLMPGVRVYPYKEIESGAHIVESLIWESRVSSRIFDQWGVSGRVNVDLTPDVAVRLAAALGAALKKGAQVVASREALPACRMDQAGADHGADLDGRRRRRPPGAPLAGERARAEASRLRRRHPRDDERERPGLVRIQFHEPPGIQLTPALQKEIEKRFSRHELRRVGANEVSAITYPARVRETARAGLCFHDCGRRRDPAPQFPESSSTAASRPRPTSCHSCSVRWE